MENKDIAKSFNLLGKLMDLHGENPFKIKSYYNAYNTLRKFERPLVDMQEAEIAEIHGLGKAIVGKIQELNTNGSMESLEQYKEMTPAGIIDMLHVRGFGPKKVSAVWNQLEIETIGELLQACEENRLVALKGFGLKTQSALKTKLEYFQASKGFYHYATAENEIEEIQKLIHDQFPEDASIVGPTARQEQIIEGIEILVTEERAGDLRGEVESMMEEDTTKLNWKGIDVHLVEVPVENYAAEQLSLNSTEDYVEYLQNEFGLELEEYLDELNEENIFEALDIPFISPPMRELFDHQPDQITEEDLLAVSNIKGIIHSHSTYSDGLHTLKDMALYCKEQGFEYLVITDHSQSAFYADGLKPDRVLEQWKEIDELNASIPDFHIFKGMESDILNDGSLDYDEEMLKGFDIIIASIHSNLNMTEEKATNRLLTAIRNPLTRILGHPTGRLLLSRQGYPIDHAAIIDACADHNVIIELNAHPNRLDLDYNWITYCREKGVKISVNPDAHSMEGIHLIRHGVRVARKAWVTPEENLSSYSLEELRNWISEK